MHFIHLLLPAVLLTTAFSLPALMPAPAQARAKAPALERRLEAFCESVHDGDTLRAKLKNGKVERVRLLGIDTPELAQKPWGHRARDFARELCLKRDISLVLDVQQRDRYGRLLAYVYAGDTFVNLELVKQGYATMLTYPPNVAHVEQFQAAQKQAREKGLNIWQPGTGLEESPADYRRQQRERNRR